MSANISIPAHLLFSAKNRQAVLQSLLTLAREFPDKCNWEEHFKSVLLRLLDLMSDSDATVKLYSLRVLREMLKTQHERLRDYAELTTLKVLKSFADPDPTVSQTNVNETEREREREKKLTWTMWVWQAPPTSRY